MSNEVRLWQNLAYNTLSRHWNLHRRALMRVWHLLGPVPCSRQALWHLCSMDMPSVWQFEANLQERSTDFKVLSRTRYDDGPSKVTVRLP